MGLLSRLKNRSPTRESVRVELMQDQGNGFYSWDGRIYYSDIIRSCIRPKVKAIGKLTAKHIRTSETEEGKKIEVNPLLHIKFLLEEPNPLMTMQLFQEKMETQLCLNNNAFALIYRDENGQPIQLYPIIASSVEAVYKGNDLYLKFYLSNGKIFVFPYSDIIHLKADYNENDIFGTPYIDSIKPLMEIVNTTDQGIVKAVKNSGIIRWLLKIMNSARPEDIKNTAKNFADSFLNTQGDSLGVAAVDAKVEAQQITPTDYVPNAAQMDRTTARLQSFFNTNNNIVQSKYTEDEWVSYFEAEIEPDARRWAEEMTRKLFTRRERGFGNKIYYEAGSLQYASMSTKLQLQAMVDRGAMTPNEWREAFNLAPVPGGDVPVRRLDTQPVEGGETVEN